LRKNFRAAANSHSREEGRLTKQNEKRSLLLCHLAQHSGTQLTHGWRSTFEARFTYLDDNVLFRARASWKRIGSGSFLRKSEQRPSKMAYADEASDSCIVFDKQDQ